MAYLFRSVKETGCGIERYVRSKDSWEFIQVCPQHRRAGNRVCCLSKAGTECCKALRELRKCVNVWCPASDNVTAIPVPFHLESLFFANTQKL